MAMFAKFCWMFGPVGSSSLKSASSVWSKSNSLAVSVTSPDFLAPFVSEMSSLRSSSGAVLMLSSSAKRGLFSPIVWWGSSFSYDSLKSERGSWRFLCDEREALWPSETSPRSTICFSRAAIELMLEFISESVFPKSGWLELPGWLADVPGWLADKPGWLRGVSDWLSIFAPCWLSWCVSFISREDILS